ncbi:MAG: DUF922 domain-containing protein [Bacteroidia bacterium]
MKVLQLFIGCVLISMAGFAQKKSISPDIRKFKKDTIVWQADSLLKKEDFKARYKGSNGPLGFTDAAIFIYPGENSGQLIFYVEALFFKSKSYIVKYSEYVLKHEQIHFDIAELYARKLRQKIADTDFKKVKDVRGEITRFFRQTFADFKKEEEKYDKDTQHGLNPAKQQLWNDDIQNRIKELDKYSDSAIDIAH